MFHTRGRGTLSVSPSKKPIVSVVGRKALGDVKNIRLNGNNQNQQNQSDKNQREKADEKICQKPKVFESTVHKEQQEEVEYCPQMEPKPDTFEDILPFSERVQANFSPNCFDKLFVTPSRPLEPFTDPWEAYPPPDTTVDDLLKQAEEMHNDHNYPIRDEDFELMKKFCFALRD